MSTLTDFLEDALAKPDRTASDKEALTEACESILVLLNPSAPSYAYQIATTNAGCLVGGMVNSTVQNKMIGILRKCCAIAEGAPIKLTAEEMQFIADGADGRIRI